MNEMDSRSFQKQKKLLQLQLHLEIIRKDSGIYTHRIANLLNRIIFGGESEARVANILAIFSFFSKAKTNFFRKR